MSLFDLYAAWVEKKDSPGYINAELAARPVMDKLTGPDADFLLQTITDREYAAYAAGFRTAVLLLAGI